jgi:hypothetical protein
MKEPQTHPKKPVFHLNANLPTKTIDIADRTKLAFRLCRESESNSFLIRILFHTKKIVMKMFNTFPKFCIA